MRLGSINSPDHRSVPDTRKTLCVQSGAQDLAVRLQVLYGMEAELADDETSAENTGNMKIATVDQTTEPTAGRSEQPQSKVESPSAIEDLESDED
jgi:hypothetical protein